MLKQFGDGDVRTFAKDEVVNFRVRHRTNAIVGAVDDAECFSAEAYESVGNVYVVVFKGGVYWQDCPLFCLPEYKVVCRLEINDIRTLCGAFVAYKIAIVPKEKLNGCAVAYVVYIKMTLYITL